VVSEFFGASQLIRRPTDDRSSVDNFKLYDAYRSFAPYAQFHKLGHHRIFNTIIVFERHFDLTKKICIVAVWVQLGFHTVAANRFAPPETMRRSAVAKCWMRRMHWNGRVGYMVQSTVMLYTLTAGRRPRPDPLHAAKWPALSMYVLTLHRRCDAVYSAIVRNQNQIVGRNAPWMHCLL